MRLWGLTRRPVLVLGVVALIGAVTGLVAALAPNERLQFMPTLSAIVLAWAVRLRDDPRERLAYRPPVLLDAGLMVLGTMIGMVTTMLAIGVANQSQLPVNWFTVWGMLFSVGTLTLMMGFVGVQGAAAVLALVQVMLFSARYLFEPHGSLIGLIAKDSPPLLAWVVSTLMWVSGLVAFAWSYPKLRRVKGQ